MSDSAFNYWFRCSTRRYHPGRARQSTAVYLRYVKIIMRLTSYHVKHFSKLFSSLHWYFTDVDTTNHQGQLEATLRLGEGRAALRE